MAFDLLLYPRVPAIHSPVSTCKFTIDKCPDLWHRVFSRRNLSHAFRHSSSNPRRLNILQPLGALFSAHVLCFEHLAASFSKCAFCIPDGSAGTWGATSFKPRNSRSFPLSATSPLAARHSPLSLLESTLVEEYQNKELQLPQNHILTKNIGGGGLTSSKPKASLLAPHRDRIGQEDAWTWCRGLKEEEKGTGARGAPVPVVGRGTKTKRAECRRLGSHPDKGFVNFR